MSRGRNPFNASNVIRGRGHSSRIGFTLVELLVVLGIISILITISLAVGGAVISVGKAKQTAETIKILDAAMTAYRSAKEQPFPAHVQHPGPGGRLTFVPLIDGVTAPADVATGQYPLNALIPTTSWFLKVVTELDRVEPAATAIDKIDSKIKKVYVSANNVPRTDVPGKKIEILDAWGAPIRMVHPRLDGVIMNGTNLNASGGVMISASEVMGPTPVPMSIWAPVVIRRNVLTNDFRAARKIANQPYMKGDSDGGQCVGDTPYFYSAGADGDPSTTDDNVYSTRPTLQPQ